MTDNEKKIIALEKEIAEVKDVLNDAIEVGRLTQLAYNKILFESTVRVPAHVNSQLTEWRAECAVLTRKVNQYIDKVNAPITTCS